MRLVLVTSLTLTFAIPAALAQPVIIPLEKQPQQQQPVVSAPPVAPPQAGPSLPSTTDVAGAPTVNPSEETAEQPPNSR